MDLLLLFVSVCVAAMLGGLALQLAVNSLFFGLDLLERMCRFWSADAS